MPDYYDLQQKPIISLLGMRFHIPHYQRGYRWTEHHVTDLLNDIWTFANTTSRKSGDFYCLQPVVVKERVNQDVLYTDRVWDVIDGQQRLTTVFIILKYLAREFLKTENLAGEYGDELYTIHYERPGSARFLADIGTGNNHTENIDFYYMTKAYDAVKLWFTDGQNVKDRSDRDKFLGTLMGKPEKDPSVQVIWYQVSGDTNGIDLFTRLNMGKIQLSNAELIKALFLSESSFANTSDNVGWDKAKATKYKIEIALQWDEMEQRLSDEDFWAFVTNDKQSDYANKIELLFNMIAGKEKAGTDKDPLFTFLYFYKLAKGNSEPLWNQWLRIEQYYLTICQWYKDKNLYHKIGFLITAGSSLRELISESLNYRKDVFDQRLDEKIRGCVKCDIEELSYEKKSDYKMIERVLSLFNVESIRSNESASDYYPFKFHKSTHWSLEHIHAQNSEGFDRSKKKPWMIWLNHHTRLMRDLYECLDNKEADTLIREAEMLNEDNMSWEKFSDLSSRVMELFSEKSGTHEDMHSITNLALLSQPDNATLNNAVFEMKRREIISMDKRGKYIPICTRRAFLKYYNSSSMGEQYYFWSSEDRKAYLAELKEVLSNYLPEVD